MKTTIKNENGATIFSLSGRLDSNTAPHFEDELKSFITAPARHLVFDFNDLEYISSAGLRIILNTAKAFKDQPFHFMACAMQDHVLEVFEISGFNTFITIHNSINQSLSALEKEHG
ncbi:STAS domain-containing protein [Desulforhopalus sp. 52FAK]